MRLSPPAVNFRALLGTIWLRVKALPDRYLQVSQWLRLGQSTVGAEGGMYVPEDVRGLVSLEGDLPLGLTASTVAVVGSHFGAIGSRVEVNGREELRMMS